MINDVVASEEADFRRKYVGGKHLRPEKPRSSFIFSSYSDFTGASLMVKLG
jgi:hypothetical protein